jgi:hypothetical protein
MGIATEPAIDGPDAQALAVWRLPHQIRDWLGARGLAIAVVHADCSFRFPSDPQLADQAAALVRAAIDGRLTELTRRGVFVGGVS